MSHAPMSSLNQRKPAHCTSPTTLGVGFTLPADNTDGWKISNTGQFGHWPGVAEWLNIGSVSLSGCTLAS